MKYRSRMPGVDIFMGLGATIDFEAGTLKRAPIIWQKIGMEWLYRCLKEPKTSFQTLFRGRHAILLLLHAATARTLQKSIRPEIIYLRNSLQSKLLALKISGNK